MRAKKIVLLGAQAVGKTSIARRFKFNCFSADYRSTIGVQLHAFELPNAPAPSPLVLWDTDGSFGEHVFDSAYIKGADGALIVADCTRPHTIDHLLRLLRRCEQTLPGTPCLTILNKVDQERPDKLTLDVIGKKCKQPVLFSAASGQGLQQTLQLLANTIDQRDTA